MYIALRDSKPGQAFRWAYAYGVLANIGILYWISIAMQVYGNLNILVSASIMGALVFTLALYPAFTFWMMARLKDHAPRWLIGSTFFMLLEWTRVYFPLEGYPWATPAYALYALQPFIQITDTIGTSGLNFIIFLTNFILAESLVCWKRKEELPKLALASVCILLLFGFIFGNAKMKYYSDKITAAPVIRGGLIQPNIPQEMKWESKYRGLILSKYRNLSIQAAENGAALIVWPEAALPMTVDAETTRFPMLRGISASADFFIGSSSWIRKNGKRAAMNSAFSIRPDGRVKLRYDKRHLVPFGEYVPLEDVLPMDSIVPGVAGSFLKGHSEKIPEINGIPYGVLICYESLFPDLPVDGVRKGAKFFVNITNDAWFEQTSGPYQHLNFGIFRSIETRRSIMRAANTGVSSWFDPTGAVHGSLAFGTEGIVMASVPLLDDITFYVKHPQFIPRLGGLLLLLLSFGAFRNRYFLDHEI